MKPRHHLPIVTPARSHRRRLSPALATVQVLACCLLGAAFVAAAVLLKNLLH